MALMVTGRSGALPASDTKSFVGGLDNVRDVVAENSRDVLPMRDNIHRHFISLDTSGSSVVVQVKRKVNVVSGRSGRLQRPSLTIHLCSAAWRSVRPGN